MFRGFLVLVLGLVGVGCDQTQTTEIVLDIGETNESKDPFVVDGGFGGMGGSGSPAIDPCVPYEDTALPAMGVGDALIVCSACFDTCSALGDSCGSYGAPCDVGGLPGVCIACCNGIVGELRCNKL